MSLSLALSVGNSCIGLSGIPTISGSFDANISSTLYFSDTDGNSQEVTLPYTGGNTWLDGVLDGNNSVFDVFLHQ